ncbi:hypothetical protein [Polyangium jinanense]|uniref:SH3 domain-containing protein n=1 Tax=Polyangium jinanense TaxID=2829994 RepID=A0A9X3X0L7_9BACT|nr:hypothetical protein [Polyangium jinanense]MDC3954165.1 hypothetical protein [Polyangium jinanense]MDC3981879.1 hypothetical protein [Polyangium jinanense]
MTTSSAPPPPSPEGRAPAPRPGRWIDTLTTLLLVATACFVAVSATPALFRAAGLAPFGPSGMLRAPLGGPATEPHPIGAGLAEEDADDDDQGSDPLLGPRFDPLRDGPRASARSSDSAEQPDEGAPRGRMRPAVVRRKATLRLSAAEDADPTGEVNVGDSVFVVREQGEWVLVLQTGAEGVLMGWMQRSQLAIR